MMDSSAQKAQERALERRFQKREAARLRRERDLAVSGRCRQRNTRWYNYNEYQTKLQDGQPSPKRHRLAADDATAMKASAIF